MSETFNDKKSNKSSEPVEAEIVSQVTEKKTTKKFNIGGLFWGSLFILIGVLLLLDNLQVVDVNFSALWQLWPIAIIGAGVSMLSLRGWVAGLVSFLMIAFTLLAVGLVAIDNRFIDNTVDSEAQIVTVDRMSDDIKNASINIKTGASEVSLLSNASEQIVEATLASDGFTLNESSERRGDTQYVNLSTGSTRNLWFGHFDNNLTVDLTQSMPLSLAINAGASRLTGDLSGVELGKLILDMGASDINVTLGSKQALQDVFINAGASAVVLRLPQTVGVRVYSDSGLTSTQFDNVPEVSEGFYQSADFDTASSKIIIRAKLGASSFRIERY